MDHPLIINLTPTGMIPTKGMSPYVPISPDEISADVERCVNVGANMLHLHARDTNGQPTYKKEIYAEIIAKVRERWPTIVIGVSLSGRNFGEYEKRSDPLNLTGDLRPDTGSLTLSSMNFPRSASVNDPDTVRRLADQMLEAGIKPELEVFDLGMVNYAHYLIKKGSLTPPYYFNIILGNIATAQARMSHLALIVNELPPGSFWSVGGIGACQFRMNMLGIMFGSGVRVGLEDTIWYNEQETILATNMELTVRINNASRMFNRPIASLERVRSMLQISAPWLPIDVDKDE
jgi:uncharacterized protein (DUF849 family)